MRVFISLLLVASQLSVFVETAQADQGSGVVISQVQAGSQSSSRLVELYNNSDEPVNITGWCLRYASAGGSTDEERACFTGSSSIENLVLGARSYLLIGSAQLKKDSVYIDSDFLMVGGLGGGASGRVYLIDENKQLVDTFGWSENGAAIHSDPNPISSNGNETKVYERKQTSPGVYVGNESRNSGVNFFHSILRVKYLIGAILEVDDVCKNISGIQVLVPGGMILGSDGKCNAESVDLCDNIGGIQLTLGPGMEVDDDNDCYQDVCLNLPGFQSTVPAGFRADTHNLLCSLNILPLQVTELLPNPDGDDKNNEFIELYNPNSIAIDLTYHVFHLGGDYVKTYSFPIGTTIEPQGYVAIYNKDVSYTLTNTLSSLRLRSLDNIHVFDVPDYANAKSGEAWALIDGVWQYTNNPTPAAPNSPSIVEQEFMSVALLTDCGEGRERNPLTKRCRNIVSSAKPSVKPCKDGQYRSEETNRCRNIITANAKPCKDNQYRSEETNRCRNLPADSVPEAGFAVQPVKESGMAFVGWWALGGVVLLAGAYGAWEWRREVTDFVHKLLKRS